MVNRCFFCYVKELIDYILLYCGMTRCFGSFCFSLEYLPQYESYCKGGVGPSLEGNGKECGKQLLWVFLEQLGRRE